MRSTYSPEFKESVVQKISTPGGPSIVEMSKNLGIHYTSIRTWMQIYANPTGMKKSKEWTPEKKLEVINKAWALGENELGEYLRSEGLHACELQEWRQAFYSAQNAAGRPKLDPELVELRKAQRELSRDLKRKDRALAEMSARIILLKKSHVLFGEIGDDE